MWKNTAESNAAEQLRAAGLKVTPARVRVLGALAAAPQPLCHADLDRQLATDREGEGALDRVTLYRVLDSLVAGGLAVRSVDDRGLFRFATSVARLKHAGHAHFHCTGCGEVFCLDAAPPRPPRLPRGFHLTEVELGVRGICANCAR
ncbi:MAG: transcriptional repressor [Gammaproteobacteria bacterium]|nr:transcriptional repressor [Gammaproteobacteria bacterium]MBU1414413.1 transcriptional repressor [Gammaproteobacteria bacterium]